MEARTPAHRLVIVEGIMGSGKSSTMRFAAARLEQAGQRATAIHERTDPHPLRATDDLVHPFQPWLDVTPAELARRSLEKWRAFAQSTRASDIVPVVDGQLFHGDLTNLFLMEAELATIADHSLAVADAISPLNPLLVYFHQADVAQAIRRICAERGDEWVRYQVDWKLQSPYARRRGLAGLDGLIELYRGYRVLTDTLFAQLDLPRLAIENSSHDWPACQRLVTSTLLDSP
jgi:hypothetical protein